MAIAQDKKDTIVVPNALELLNTPVWIWDLEAEHIIWGNPSCLELWGADSMAQLQQMDFSNQPVRKQFKEMSDRFRQGLSVEEEQVFSIGGTPTTVTCQCQGIDIDGFDLTTLVEVRQVARSPLDANVQSSIEALQHTPAMVSIYNLDGVCLMRNPAAMRSFGFLQPDEQEKIYDRICQDDVKADIKKNLDRGTSYSGEIMTKTKQGERWHHFDARIILNQNNSRVILVNELDVHKRKMASDQAYRLAYYDTLTHLPNRVAFANRVDDILLGLTHNKEASALVLFLNVNNFSDVNSTFGFGAGDELLRDIGQRLSENLPEIEIVSRIGADKFAIVYQMSADASELERFVGRVVELFDTPFQIMEHAYLVGVRMGISLIPEHAQSETEASRVTDLALNHAKHKGRNAWVLYNHRMSIETFEKTQRVQQLYEAMAKGQFMLYFQPQINLETGRMVGAETLMRWQREDGKFVSPAIFIPLAEQMGVIQDITRWVIRESCRLNRNWSDKGLGDIRVAVNISGAEFSDPNFVEMVKDAIFHSGMKPELLELEVTETALVDDFEQAIATLNSVKALGVEVAIDDFGTGHSSLNYLKCFPLDRLKIDKSFVDELQRGDTSDLAIVKAILDMAEAFDIETIAEGVEHAEQAEILKNIGCREAQGYYFSKPVSVSEFERLLMENTPSEN